MRRWEGTKHSDPQAIARIDRYLREVDAGLGNIDRGRLPSAGGGSALLGSKISHHALLDLTDGDDHPQYLFLAGRTSGNATDRQQKCYGAYGGTNTNSLILEANPTPTGSQGVSQIKVVDYVPALVGPAIEARTTYHRKYDPAGSREGAREVATSTSYRAQIFGSLEVNGSGTIGTTGTTILTAGVGGGYTNAVALRLARGTSGQTSHIMDVVSQDNSTVLSFIDAAGVWNGATSGAMTPSSLSVADANLSILDDGDPSKIAKFQCASISAATTRTFTFPDADQIIAGRNVDNAFTADQTHGTTGIGGTARNLTVATDPGTFAGANGTGVKIADVVNGGTVLLVPEGSGSAVTVQIPDTTDDHLVTSSSANNLSNKTLLLNAGNIIEVAATNGVLFSKGAVHTAGFRLSAAAISAATIRDLAVLNYGGNLPLVGGAAAAAAGVLLKVDSTALTAIVGATNIVAAPVAGMYQVSYYYETTTATGGDGTVTFQVNYADDIGATNQVSAALSLAATGFIAGSFTLYAAAGTALSYQTNQATGVYTAATTRTALRVRTTFLG